MKLIIDYIVVVIISLFLIAFYYLYIEKNLITNIIFFIFSLIDFIYFVIIVNRFLKIRKLQKLKME